MFDFSGDEAKLIHGLASVLLFYIKKIETFSHCLDDPYRSLALKRGFSLINIGYGMHAPR